MPASTHHRANIVGSRRKILANSLVDPASPAAPFFACMSIRFNLIGLSREDISIARKSKHKCEAPLIQFAVSYNCVAPPCPATEPLTAG